VAASYFLEDEAFSEVGMTKRLRRPLLAVVVFVVGAPSVYGQLQRAPSGAPFVWWRSEQVRKELGLTTDQSDRIGRIWEAARPELRQEWDELSKLEDKLSQLIQSDADEAVLSRQIDRVETARATANKTRSVMLVQMFKVLTPDQRSTLNALYEKWLREQPTPPRRPSPPRRPPG
jgi:Spy/CpxP family protein refolding chaperone